MVILFIFVETSTSNEILSSLLMIGSVIIIFGLITSFFEFETKEKTYKVIYSTEFKNSAIDINSNYDELKYVTPKGKVKTLSFNRDTKIKYINSNKQQIKYKAKEYYNKNLKLKITRVDSITIYQEANN